MKTITQRVLYQLEFERARQLVLSQHNSESYFEQTLRACREKLAYMRANARSNRQKHYFDSTVLPSLGASLRFPSRLTDKGNQFDYIKANASWQTFGFSLTS